SRTNYRDFLHATLHCQSADATGRRVNRSDPSGAGGNVMSRRPQRRSASAAANRFQLASAGRVPGLHLVAWPASGVRLCPRPSRKRLVNPASPAEEIKPETRLVESPDALVMQGISTSTGN